MEGPELELVRDTHWSADENHWFLCVNTTHRYWCCYGALERELLFPKPEDLAEDLDERDGVVVMVASNAPNPNKGLGWRVEDADIAFETSDECGLFVEEALEGGCRYFWFEILK